MSIRIHVPIPSLDEYISWECDGPYHSYPSINITQNKGKLTFLTNIYCISNLAPHILSSKLVYG
jgi:hypothetical protein